MPASANTSAMQATTIAGDGLRIHVLMRNLSVLGAGASADRKRPRAHSKVAQGSRFHSSRADLSRRSRAFVPPGAPLRIPGHKMRVGASTSAARRAEEGPVKLPRLRGREARLRKRLDSLICEVTLTCREWWRVPVVPVQTGLHVCIEPRSLACDFVGHPVQFAHLVEQRLKLLFVHGHHSLRLPGRGFGSLLGNGSKVHRVTVYDPNPMESFRRAGATGAEWLPERRSARLSPDGRGPAGQHAALEVGG